MIVAVVGLLNCGAVLVDEKKGETGDGGGIYRFPSQVVFICEVMRYLVEIALIAAQESGTSSKCQQSTFRNVTPRSL